MPDREVLIASACRLPIGRFLGGLSSFKVTQLGSLALGATLERAGVPAEAVDEVILGNVLTAGIGQNPARQAALGAGLPPAPGCLTINKVCGSGMKSVILAAQAIRAGDAEVVLAGGMESMSNAPYVMPKGRTGARLGHAELLDSMITDGLWEAFEDYHMGNTAELVAREHSVSREQQDEYAARSHIKAAAAQAAGAFDAEIVPVEVKGRKGAVTTVAADEGVRADATAASMGRLSPAFEKEGTVTAGNASQISDGAAGLLVVSREAADRLGVKPLAKITGYATSGLEPRWVMMTPVAAMNKLAERTGKPVNSYDLYELNEAFAVQGCALLKELELDADRVNVNGGAVALGHPIGASGGRIIVTLLHALRARGGGAGVASLCMGGANGLALSIETL